MKRKLTRLSRQYAAALRKHLERGPRGSLQPARGLGHQAVGLGLETLELARMHEGALAALKTPSRHFGRTSQATTFFNEALTAVEQTHRAALRTRARLHQANQTLRRRTADLAVSTRSLKQSVVRRKGAEQALKTSGGHSQKLLEESRRLQQHLRHLVQQLLTAQEEGRKRMSHDLQDDIAQTLLGINVRLLTLKQVAALNDRGLNKEIASTERLVNNSVQSIQRFAREVRKRHAA
jgi:two-component system, NarL family, sensor histidine kinase DegS